MQKLAVDGHEWNNAMRVELMSNLHTQKPINWVQHLTLEVEENFLFYATWAKKKIFVCGFCFKLVKYMYIINFSVSKIKIFTIILNFIVTSTRSCISKNGTTNGKRSYSQSSLDFLWGICYTLITAVNMFSHLPQHPWSICLFYRKRHLTAVVEATVCSSLNLYSRILSMENLLLSSSGKGGNTSAPCLFTFSTCQKRSKSEDHTAWLKQNSIKALQWKQYHPYFKQLAPNRGSLTLGCQLFHFSGFCSKPLQLRCASWRKPLCSIVFLKHWRIIRKCLSYQ